MSFKVWSQMVPDIPGNFKIKFKSKMMGRIAYCVVLDLTNIADLVFFFGNMRAERYSMEPVRRVPQDSIAQLL